MVLATLVLSCSSDSDAIELSDEHELVKVVIDDAADAPAGVDVLDMDSDGDLDLVVTDGFGQAAGGTVADIDGDGLNKVLFTSYEENELAVFAWTTADDQVKG